MPLFPTQFWRFWQHTTQPAIFFQRMWPSVYCLGVGGGHPRLWPRGHVGEQLMCSSVGIIGWPDGRPIGKGNSHLLFSLLAFPFVFALGGMGTMHCEVYIPCSGVWGCFWNVEGFCIRFLIWWLLCFEGNGLGIWGKPVAGLWVWNRHQIYYRELKYIVTL